MCTCGRAHAQSSDGRWEAGVFAGAIDFRETLYEKPVALGARIGYRLTEHIAFEAEATTCPKNGGGNFGQRLFVVGPRIGVAIGPIGIAAKVRAGAVHFGGKAFRAQNPGVDVKPVVNIGAVIELGLSRYAAMRIDVGDTIIPFGSTVVRGPFAYQAAQYGTTHNMEATYGFSFRF